jgi:hypothetical protein
MAAIPFTIETRHFAKKNDAMRFFRAMLNRYRPGERVNEDDARDLAALLKHHTEYQEKVGAGIAHFGVMKNLYFTQSFEIVRLDGSRDDFSYKHCITPKQD